MIYHRKHSPSQSDDDLRKQIASNELWGFPRRNIHVSDFPCIKAWRGELPMDAEGGIEFETGILPRMGGHPDLPEWELRHPEVRNCNVADCVCMTVKIRKYKFREQQVVIL